MNTKNTKATETAKTREILSHEVLALTVVPSMSKGEDEDLKRHETVIQTNFKAFFDVARAFAEIKYNHLYRNEFQTFEEYCHKRWDIVRSHAYRLLKAVEIQDLLSPIGDIPLPENECQVRALAYLPKTQVRKAWLEAVAIAGKDKVSGKIVHAVVKKFLHKKKAKTAERLAWQLGVLPLLRKAGAATRAGDRGEAVRLFNRINLLLQVGTYKFPDDIENP